MSIGYLTVKVAADDDFLPVENAHVLIKRTDGSVLFDTYTDADGNTGVFPLEAPDMKLTLDPDYNRPAYSVCDVTVIKEGYLTKHIRDVEIVDTQTSILPVTLHPLQAGPGAETEEEITVPPVGLLIPSANLKAGPPDVPESFTPDGEPEFMAGETVPSQMQPQSRASESMMPQNLMPDNFRRYLDAQAVAMEPIPLTVEQPLVLPETLIPDYITVHLGTPTNASARNVRVKFPDYIKNVVSSEIYSTWPLNSLISNIHVIVTFALNRIFTEWYRSRGFNFDITNSTAYDQYYRDGGPVFENISKLVDSYFNIYVRRIGFRNPFFTQFCNGTTVTCAGLSQWGTVTLANQGKTPIEILRYYYPDDIELNTSWNISSVASSYPGYTLRVGSTGEAVRRMQNFLNRIRVNYPLIPRIANPNGVFGSDTETAVRTFQRTFNMTADGAIGNATWNKISFIYVGVTRLAELDGEGERITIGTNPPNVVLSVGSRGANVLELQFILNTVSAFYNTVPTVIKDGVFDATTKNAVIEFQKTFGLSPDGVVGVSTWNKLYSVYRGIAQNAPVPEVPPAPPVNAPPYPGTPLRVGSSGPNVRTMQTYLNTVRIVYTNIPYLTVDGIFGPQMEATVKAFQQEFLLAADGVIGSATWNKIVQMYLLVTGNTSVALQYPGTPLRKGSTGSDVRLMQGFLNEIRSRFPSLPAVSVDGIFGPNTENAVMTFQRIMGLTPDGVIGPVTWYAIIDTRNSLV